MAATPNKSCKAEQGALQKHISTKTQTIWLLIWALTTAPPNKSYVAKQGALQKQSLLTLVLAVLRVAAVGSCLLEMMGRNSWTMEEATPHKRPKAEEGALQNLLLLCVLPAATNATLRLWSHQYAGQVPTLLEKG